MKILFLDLETSPHLSWAWGKYDVTTIKNVSDSQILSFAWKWLHEKQVYVMAQCDYLGYHRGKLNDYKLIKDLWDILDKADVVIAHNGDRFDVKMSNARFVFHKLTPPSFYKTIDTKKVAKRTGMFPSNKLNDLGEYFGVGKKMSTGGFELWEECMAGNQSAWNKMKLYNKQDVVLLEKVYERLLPWIQNHPNLNVYENTKMNCTNCGSERVHQRGYGYTKTGRRKKYVCTQCGSWSSGNFIKSDVILR